MDRLSGGRQRRYRRHLRRPHPADSRRRGDRHGRATNCNVSLLTLDMLGADDRFDGGFVGVDVTDRRDGAIWSWANGDESSGGDCAVLGTDNRWHSRACTETHQFACAVSRAGDPTTWDDVLQEAWKVTSASGTWEQGSLLCQQEFGAEASPYVFAAPRNGRSNQKLIAARDAASLGGSDIWLGYSNTGARWSTDTPPLVKLAGSTVNGEYSGGWTNQDVSLDLGPSLTGSDSGLAGVNWSSETRDFNGNLLNSNSGSFSFAAADRWGTVDDAFAFTANGVTTITMQATSVDGVVGPQQTFMIMIDKTPPESALTIGQPQTPHGARQPYVTGATSFTLDATDIGAGVAKVSYRVFPQGQGAPSYTDVSGATATFTLTGADGWYQIDSYATDLATNTDQPQTRLVYLDNSAPVITLTQPAGTTYTHSSLLTLNYSVSDGTGSGVTSYAVKMDNSTTLTPSLGGSKHGLQSGQTINLLTTLALGQHVLLIDQAVDSLGNTTRRQVRFTIIATPQSIKEDVTLFLAMGAITDATWSNTLLTTLNNAQAAWNRHDCRGATDQYTAFINELRLQSGRKISEKAAYITIADARYLIDHCG